MKKLIIVGFLLFVSNVTAKEFILETINGADVPVREMPSDLNFKDTQSELGQLSANILSYLYTYIQNIEYTDDNAVVYARYGSMDCVMRYKYQNKKWKLTKLRCPENRIILHQLAPNNSNKNFE